MPPKIGKMKSLQEVLQKDAQFSKQKGERGIAMDKRKTRQTQNASPSFESRSVDIEAPLINIIGQTSKRNHGPSKVASTLNREMQDEQPSFDLGIDKDIFVENNLIDKEQISGKPHTHIVNSQFEDDENNFVDSEFHVEENNDFIDPLFEVDENTNFVDSQFEPEEDNFQSEFDDRNIEDVLDKAFQERNTKRKRGDVTFKTIAPKDGERYTCICDKITGRPVGKIAQKLAFHLGINARRRDYFHVDTFWKDMHKEIVEKVLRRILVLYKFVKVIDETILTDMKKIVDYCEVQIKDRLIQWHYRLKKKYFIQDQPFEEQLQRSLDPRVTNSQWINLLKYWCSPNAQAKSAQNKNNRGGQRPTYICGSVSYATIGYEMRKEKPNVSALDVYLKGHIKKNGQYPNDFTKNACDAIQNECEQKGKENTEDPLEFTNIMDKVHGKHHGGYLRGYGKRVIQRELLKRSLHDIGLSAYTEIQEEFKKKERELLEAKAKFEFLTRERNQRINEESPRVSVEEFNDSQNSTINIRRQDMGPNHHQRSQAELNNPSRQNFVKNKSLQDPRMARRQELDDVAELNYPNQQDFIKNTYPQNPRMARRQELDDVAELNYPNQQDFVKNTSLQDSRTTRRQEPDDDDNQDCYVRVRLSSLPQHIRNAYGRSFHQNDQVSKHGFSSQPF